MTTDTEPKLVTRRGAAGGRHYTIVAVAKGAGMIRPDMATMLAYIATDARVAGDRLQQLLEDAVEQSFNAITVDGDTSTNDACVLLASGTSGVSVDTVESDEGRALAAAVAEATKPKASVDSILETSRDAVVKLSGREMLDRIGQMLQLAQRTSAPSSVRVRSISSRIGTTSATARVTSSSSSTAIPATTCTTSCRSTARSP